MRDMDWRVCPRLAVSLGGLTRELHSYLDQPRLKDCAPHVAPLLVVQGDSLRDRQLSNRQRWSECRVHARQTRASYTTRPCKRNSDRDCSRYMRGFPTHRFELLHVENQISQLRDRSRRAERRASWLIVR